MIAILYICFYERFLSINKHSLNMFIEINIKLVDFYFISKFQVKYKTQMY